MEKLDECVLKGDTIEGYTVKFAYETLQSNLIGEKEFMEH